MTWGGFGHWIRQQNQHQYIIHKNIKVQLLEIVKKYFLLKGFDLTFGIYTKSGLTADT